MMVEENFPHKWMALIGLCLLSFTSFLDFTIVTTALPFIQKDLNASIVQLQWVINIMAMIQCMFMLAAGRAGDLFGRKRIFFFGFIIFGIAAIGAALSPNIHILIFFRAIQAFSGAIIFTVGATLLPQAFPLDQQTRAIGIFSAFNGAGLAIGPFLGGILISLLSWRWVFWVNLPFIIVGFLLCGFTLKPSPKPDQAMKIDWLGLFLLVIGLGFLVYGIIQGGSSDWSPVSLVMMAVGLIGLFLFVKIETKAEVPLLDLSLLKNRYVCLAALVCSTAGIVTFGFMFFDPLYFKLIRGQSAFEVGLCLLSVTIVQVIISLLLVKILKFFSIYKLLILGILTTCLSAILHALFYETTSIILVLITLILMGYTWAIANAGGITAVSHSVTTDKLGGAIGTIFTLWNLSGAIFLSILTIIFHQSEHSSLKSLLQKMHFALTQEQNNRIRALLSNPDEAIPILKTIEVKNPHLLLEGFRSSFIHAYHWVYWASTLITFVLLLLGLCLRSKKANVV